MPEILHTLPIHGPRSKVYQALTEQEGLQGWWTRFARAEPTIGYSNESGFGGAFKFEMRVDGLEPDTHVKWTCLSGHSEWQNTVITFDLEDLPGRENATLLRFAHKNWLRSDGVLPNCSYDWAQYLRSLRLFIEEGRGTPS